MILKSIRLHPFASFTDKTIEFTQGMNVVCGENEAGKSTIFRSIRSVLFYSIQPAKNSIEFKEIQKYFPLPQSNFIQVSLKFTCNNEEGELTKLWSTNHKESKVLLTYRGQSIIGEKEVEAAMTHLLKLNRASWEHILFIPQSSIQQTIRDFKENSNQLQSIDHSLQQESGDIDSSKFIVSLREEIEQYYQRWDKENSQPEGGKGVNNPWKQNVGKILEAYYEKEKIVASLIELEATTDKFDIINKNIYEIEALVSPLEAFIKEGQPLLADATAREGIENNIAQIDAKINPLKGIYKEWIMLEGTLPELQNQYQKSEERLSALNDEIINSEKKKKYPTLLEKYGRIKQHFVDKKRNSEQIVAIGNIEKKLIEDCRSHKKIIESCEIKIAAQKIKVEITASSPLTADIITSTNKIEKISLVADEKRTIESGGVLQIKYGPLQVKVMSGVEDIESLEKKIEEQTKQLQQKLLASGASSFEALELKEATYSTLLNEGKLIDNNLTNILSQKTEKEWDDYMESLSSLPAARELDFLKEELEKERNIQARGFIKLQEAQEKYNLWIKTYSSTDALESIIAEKSIEKKQEEKKLQGLSALPSEYPNASAFLAKVNMIRDKADQYRKDLSILHQDKQRQQDNLDRAEWDNIELKERLRLAESSFDHVRAEANGLERVEAACLEIMLKQSRNPYEKFRIELIELVKELSGGRYTNLETDEYIPISLNDGNKIIMSEILSGGMMGSLALALRLNFARTYLKDMKGFIMMDDPFTELDAGRRNHAASVLKKLATEKQLVFFTCHKDHAGLFEKENIINI